MGIDVSSRQVLIVEDDVMTGLDLGWFVEDHLLASPVVVSTIDQAMAVIDQPFDRAFLDVGLFDGDSYGLADKLLARGVPVVFISAANPETLPKRLGSVPFLSKPFNETQLAAAMAHG